MNFFQKLFGYRSTLSASSSLGFGVVLDQASAFCHRMKELDRDVMFLTVSNTNSMLPTIDANAVVLLEKVPFTLLREGDIVTYVNRGIKVIHRLNERRGTNWWPLGDGNTTVDPALVTPENFDRRLCGILYAEKAADTDR